MKTQPSPAHSPQRRQTLLFFLFLASYLLAYIVLSSHGSYIGHNEGGSDNRDTWYPEYCAETYKTTRVHVRLTPLGWLFLPPMLIDQYFIHRTLFNVE